MEILPIGDITIIEELDRFLPELDEEEILNLEKEINRDGVRDPLVIWTTSIEEEEKHVLVDGHNRLRILQNQLKNEAPVIYTDFPDITEAKQWMLDNQLSRRNLNVFTRVQLALKLEDELKERAADRKKNGWFGANATDSLISDAPTEKGTVLEILAKKASTSKDTVYKIRQILKSDPRLRELIEKKEVSINQAAKIAALDDEKRIEAIQVLTGSRKHIPFGEGEAFDEDSGTWFQYIDSGGSALGDSIPVVKNIENESMDLVFSDPPYNADVAKWDRDFNPIWFLDECARVVKPGGSVLIFCSHHLLKYYLMHDPKGLTFRQIIHWTKTNPVPYHTSQKSISAGKKKSYTFSVEYLLWWTKGTKYTFNADQISREMCGNNLKDVFSLPLCGGSERIKDTEGATEGKVKMGKNGKIKYPTFHPTQKPLELIKAILAVHSNEGDGILEPFLGSGTTFEACTEMGRNLYMCEMNPVYMRKAQSRDKRKSVKPVLTAEQQQFMDDNSNITESEIIERADKAIKAIKAANAVEMKKPVKAKKKKVITKVVQEKVVHEGIEMPTKAQSVEATKQTGKKLPLKQ